MANSADNKMNKIFDSILGEDSPERLNPDEIANLTAESGSTGEETPPDVITQPTEGTEGTETTPQPETTTEVTEAAPSGKERKPLTPAQERIQELVRERNELDARNREYQERWARLEERQKLVNQTVLQHNQEQKQRQEAQRYQQWRQSVRPDPAVDPVGAELFDAREETARVRAELNSSRQEVAQRLAAQEVNSEVRNFASSLQNDIARFHQAVPDYNEAAQHLASKRIDLWHNQLGKPLAEARQLVQSEAMAIAKAALDKGQSPAATYYQMAKDNGYVPEAGTSSGRSADVSPRERIAQAAAGQKVTGFSNRSAAGTSETFTIDTMSAAQLAAMDEDRFLELLRDPRTASAMNRRLSALELG